MLDQGAREQEWGSANNTKKRSWSEVAHTFNPNTQKAETGGSLWVWGQPGQQSKFYNKQGYQRYPVSKKQNSNKPHLKKKRQTKETEFLSDGRGIILDNVQRLLA